MLLNQVVLKQTKKCMQADGTENKKMKYDMRETVRVACEVESVWLSFKFRKIYFTCKLNYPSK